VIPDVDQHLIAKLNNPQFITISSPLADIIFPYILLPQDSSVPKLLLRAFITSLTIVKTFTANTPTIIFDAPVEAILNST